MEQQQHEPSPHVDIGDLVETMMLFPEGHPAFDPGMDEYKRRGFHKREDRQNYEKQVSRLLDLQQEVLNVVLSTNRLRAYW